MRFELTKGAFVEMHPACGMDELVALSVRSKMQPFLADHEDLPATYVYQRYFADIVARTDGMEGINFLLPDPHDEGAFIADRFREWLTLRRKLFNAWCEATEKDDETYNAPDLLPREKVSAGALDNPLPPNGVLVSEKS